MSRKLTLERVPHTFDPRDFLLASIPEDQELSDLEGDQEYREICALADRLSKRIKTLEQRAVRRVSTPRHRRSVSAPAKVDSGGLETSNVEYTCPETNNTEHRHWYLPYQYQSGGIVGENANYTYLSGPSTDYTPWQPLNDAHVFQIHPNTEYIDWQPDNAFLSSSQPHPRLQAPHNFFTFSYQPTMESSESAEKLLGDLKCTACISRPTHKIVPCQHPVCYDHLLVGHDEESEVASVCARCHQTVIKVVEISEHARSSSTSLSTTLSPNGKNIWSPTHTHSLPSLSERVSAMIQPSKESGGLWPVPEFVPQTQSQSMAGAPQHHYGQEPATQHQSLHGQESATQQLDNPADDKQPGNNANDKQHAVHQRVKDTNDKQHAVHQRVKNDNSRQHQSQQRVFGQQAYPGQQAIMSHGQHYPVHQATLSYGPQYPTHQAATNYFGPPPSHHYSAVQPNVNNYYPSMPPGYQMGMNLQYSPTAQAQAQAQSTNDPFVDNTPMRYPPRGFAPPGPHPAMYNRCGATVTAPPPAMHHRGSGIIAAAPPIPMHSTGTRGVPTPSVTTPSPVQGYDQMTEAARLAQAIKSGMYDEPNDNRGNRRRESIVTPQRSRRTTGEWALQQPVQQPVRPIVRQNFDTPDVVPDPPFFGALARGYRPTYPEALEFMPFTEQYKNIQQRDLGVVKILNIPYGTTKNEIVAAVGRNARLVNQPAGTPYYAIHIIMERSTGKTMDCFVELASHAEAATTVHNFQQRVMNSRQPRIGDRHVEVELSSQEDLMKELFPRARCVKWAGNVPTVFESDEPFNSGFRGYLTGEEMVMVQKHAETPQRSPFAQRCHNRTYECLISTLHKYPWSAIDSVTIGERDLLFTTAVACLRALMNAIQKNSNPPALTRQLLQEVICATLVPNGFNPRQKTFICDLVEQNGFPEVIGSVSYTHLGNIGFFWPFEVLDKKPGASIGVLQFYVDILREGSMTAEEFQQLSIYGSNSPESPFGNITVNYGNDKGELSVKHAAMLEWNILESTIRKALSPEGQQAAITSG